MSTASARYQASHYRIALWLCAIGSVFLIGAWQPIQAIDVRMVSLCFLLAVVAELKPVHFAREGVMLCLSMPFVAGVLISGGPAVAALTEAAVLTSAALIRVHEQRRRRTFFWASFNIPLGTLSSALGGFSFLLVSRQGSPVAGVCAYAVTYLVANFLLISWFNSRMEIGNFIVEVIRGYRGLAIGTAIYLFVTLCVGTLVNDAQALLLPLLLIPTFLLRSIVDRLKRIDDLEYESIVALTIMLQRAHPYTHGHLERVGRVAEKVGIRLGIPQNRARLLREAAVLHDIGKIAIDEDILDKPAKLTDEEYAHVKKHSEFGAQILQESDRFRAIVPWIRYHHERPDGRGYPMQLTDLEIPIESKIIAVADAFDAMVGGTESSEKRSYRSSMTIEAALEELYRCSDTQFDRNVVKVFESVIMEEPA